MRPLLPAAQRCVLSRLVAEDDYSNDRAHLESMFISHVAMRVQSPWCNSRDATPPVARDIVAYEPGVLA